MALIPISVNAETYTAAGQKFVGNGSTFSSIGGYSTSSMTFAGTGGIMLYNAFSNLDNQISAVKASAVTASSLSDAFSQYFGSGGIYNALLFSQLNTYFTPGHANNIHSLLSSVNTHTSQTVDNTSKISDRLMYNNTSAAGWLYAINQAVLDGNAAMAASQNLINRAINAKASYRIYKDPDGSYTITDNLLGALSFISQLLLSTNSYGGEVLGADGLPVSLSTSIGTAEILSTSLLGLSCNLAGSDKSSEFNPLIPVGGPLQEQEITVDNVLDAITLVGTHLQNPLAKLQYVLADDDDLILKDAVKDNQQSVTDSFTGSGPGAIGTGDITDVADISGGIRDSFGGAGSAGDAFSVISDGDTWSFFSAETASNLDTVGALALVDERPDSYLDGYYLGDDGLYHLASGSLFDVDAYLEGLK